jgi:peptidyl-prolyl cis-trans isomerase SurA
MKKFLLPAAIALIITSQSASALDYKILAVVNGESISTVQLKDRVELVISSSGLKDDYATRKKQAAEVIEILINEALQKQDAAEKGIVVDSAEMPQVITDLEKSNGLKPGGFKSFITSKGISYETAMDQIYAGVLWKKILAKFVRPGLIVSKEDIAKAAAVKEPEVKVKTAVNMSEIIIPIEIDKEAETKALAESIVRMARSGGKDFGELALERSAGKTADKKGALGWLPEDGVVEPLASYIKKTKAGGVTDPIKVDSLYVILKVNDRKTSSPPQPKMSPEDRALMAKLEEGSKKYIKQLRDAAFIERKFKDEELAKLVWG